MASLDTGRRVKKKRLPEKIEFSPVLHAKQREMWNDDHRFICIAAGRRFGKALALDTPILKSDFSWSTVGELQIGDWIFDESGKPVEITELHGIYYNRPCYEVVFDNGDRVVADEQHDWVIYDGLLGSSPKKVTTYWMYIYLMNGGRLSLPHYETPIDVDKAHYIVAIKKVESVPVKCITVNNESHLFLAGKTLIPTHNSYFCAYRIIYEALSKPNSVNWVVAPTYAQTMLIWRKILMLCPQDAVHEVNRTDNTIYLINGSSIWAKSGANHDCYDDKTEVLTSEGWKYFKDLNKSEDIMTLNPETLSGEWKKPIRYIDDPYDGEMISISGRNIDYCVTPNHNFFVRHKRVGSPYSFVEAQDIDIHSHSIPTSCTWEGIDDLNISEEDCAIMGMYLAEGTAYGNCGGDITKRRGNYEVFFAQQDGIKGGIKGDVKSAFREILVKKGFKTIYDRGDGLYVLNKELWSKLIPLGNKYTKYIPKNYKDLPLNKLRILFDWLILGDGGLRIDKEGHSPRRVYYSASLQLANDVQEIAIKCGFSATVRVKCISTHVKGEPIKNPRPLYVVYIRKSKHNYFRSGKNSLISTINYTGRIYCVEVENHIIMTRRNGICGWSGNSLRGEGIDFLVVEEAGFLKQDIWDVVLRPALADKKGKGIIISTPLGKNLFYKLFCQGVPEADGSTPDDEWRSYNCSSWDNPILDRRELETLKRTLPPRSYQQEIMAQFIDDAGSVFTNIDGCVRDGGFRPPIWNYYYLMGVDLAKYDDYTVITVMDVANRDVVYWQRFNNRDWVTQKQNIMAVCEMFNKCPVCLDSTGVGDPIADDLYAAGVPVRPFKFSLQSKTALVKKLQFAIENRQFTMPRIDQLLHELQMYSYTMTPSGQIVYAAPNGQKDDTVMSLGLVVYHMDLVLPNLSQWDYY